MNMTSNCDVTNSAHQIQMTIMCHWMKPLPWKFSAYATGAGPADDTRKVKGQCGLKSQGNHRNSFHISEQIYIILGNSTPHLSVFSKQW